MSFLLLVLAFPAYLLCVSQDMLREKLIRLVLFLYYTHKNAFAFCNIVGLVYSHFFCLLSFLVHTDFDVFSNPFSDFSVV